MSTKIYTKAGDKGRTALLGGINTSKSDPRIAAYGTVDELNACLGLAVISINHDAQAGARLKHIRAQIEKIQNQLFNIGGQLACANDDWRSKIPHINHDDIRHLELEIDKHQEELPPLSEFILPGGTLVAGHLHLARTVCRRAEREIVAAFKESRSEDQLILEYINRLSDYLFVIARAANNYAHIPDSTWKKNT